MFVCYLDDSGTSGLPVTTLAGFVATQAQWTVLEPQLDAIMNAYGVPVFHAKQFHDTKPPFKGWSKVKKLSFAEEIFSTTSRRIFGVSVTMRRSDYLDFQRKSGDLQNMSVMGVCFATIVTCLMTDPAFKAGTFHHGVSFVIEAGNANEGELASYFQKMQVNPGFEGKLISLDFVAKDHGRAIQLADYFAFYSRRYMRDQDRFSGRLALPEPPFLNVIRKHGPMYQSGLHGEVSTVSTVGKVAEAGDFDRVIASMAKDRR